MNVSQALSVSPPKEFNFRDINSWQKWLQRFEQYLSVIQIKTNEEKCNLLLYCMGEESLDILHQVGKEENYDEIIKKFNNYFNPRKNLIFERAQFNRRHQVDGESSEDYIKNVFKLSQNCEFEKITKNEIIRDKLVVGIQDKNLSEKLQMKNDLTLEEAIQCIRENEIQKSQTNELYKEHVRTDINVIAKTANNCTYCGLKYHNRNLCPARISECYKCSNKGHYARMCKKMINPRLEKAKVRAVEKENTPKEFIEDTGNEGNYFLWSMEGEEPDGAWICNIMIKDFNRSCQFLVDSGADIICIPFSVVPEKFLSKIKKSDVVVRTADGRKLDISGYVMITLIYRSISYHTKAYIVKAIKRPILSRKASQSLKILTVNLNMLNSNKKISKVNIYKEFPLLLQELGQLKDVISIKLKPDAKPFVQSTPRIVPIALLDKLKNELQRLQELDIIEPIEQVTEWVSPIVVVQKGENEIRLCCDYTQLNKSVMRPYFPIPKVEYTLAKVKGAKYFSKIDITKSFHQLVLDKESQLLTTFISPFGRFKYKRLPFGLNCSTEYFISKFSKLLEGLNVIFHVDDVLIYNNTIEGHDECLREVLRRLSDAGLTINIEKCIIGVQEIKFLGFVLSSNGISIDLDRVKAISNFPKPDNKTELQRFLGMVNFASKHLNKKADCLAPLNDLLRKDTGFYWGPDQDVAFNSIKKNCVKHLF